LGTTVDAQTINAISHSRGKISEDGDVQTNQVLLYGQIAQGATEILYTDGSGGEIAIKSGLSIGYEIHLVARAANGDSSFRKYEGLAKNVSGTTTLVGNVEIIVVEDADLLETTITASTGKLRLEVRNDYDASINVSAYVRWTQIGY